MTYVPTQFGVESARPGPAVGQRLAAWVVDLILYLAVALGTFFAIATREASTSSFDGRAGRFSGFETSFCTRLREARPVSECIELGDSVWYTTGGRSIAHFLVAIAWFAGIHVVLQGLTGGSLGKLATGVRVVQEDGSRPGIGRAFVRSALWIVDGLPCCMPLVGLITMLATDRKQRVGDLVAKTFVVKASDRARPVTSGGSATAPPPGVRAGSYQAPPGYPPPPPPGYSPPPT